MARTNTNTGGSGAVSQLIAGSGISLSPSGGTGTVTITNTGSESGPFTIQNATSIFSTGLTGLWNSTATNSFVVGPQAGDNDLGSTDSVNWIGELAGASDLSDTMNASKTNFIGNRAGYNAFNAENSSFMGYLTGAYATNASFSFFAGSQAGQEAVYAGNSFFFGQGAGYQATNAAGSIFMGLLSGESATNAAASNFLGSNSGNGATNANNATFIGSYSGFNDIVNNQGLITYSSETNQFIPAQPITSSSGGSAVVISDDGAGNMVIADSIGSWNVGDTITQTNGGYTASPLVTYRPSTSSILIGDHTNTGGGVNSVAIGSGASNAGFDNSIVIGVGGVNTLDNQYAWGDSIINWKFGGNNYQLPFYLPGGSGQYLGSSSSGILNWSVPGTSGGISVVAATITALPSYTFNNLGGPGDTITANANGALPVIDGITLVDTNTLLIKDETGGNSPFNGVYVVTQIGDSGTPFILTRTTSADTSSQFNDMVVTPAQGLTQSAVPFGQQTPNPVVDTDSILFTALMGVYVKQQTSGTQVANQIPIYTGTALTLTKGTSDFTYDPSARQLIIDATNLNTFIGVSTGNSSVSGQQNVVIGLDSLGVISSGGNNTVLGSFSGNSISTGFDNIIIGDSSGNSISTGNANIVLGHSADTSGDVTNAIAIGVGATAFGSSIALGANATNTTTNQIIFDPTITHYTLNLVAYGSDALAGAAGLTTGDQYQTSGTGLGIFAFVGVTMTKQ